MQSNGGSSAVLNLLIPKESVASLRIPPVALTTGGDEVVWCDRTWGHVRWIGPKLSLPYDPASAAKLSRGARFAPIHWVILLGYLVLAAVALAGKLPSHSWWLPVSTGVLVVSGLLAKRWDVPPTPQRTSAGDLYLPGVPEQVADRWRETNSFVRLVDRPPAFRRYSRRRYLSVAASCTLAAIVAGGFAFTTGSGLLLAAALLLLGAAVLVFSRALPPGYIRFDRTDTPG